LATGHGDTVEDLLGEAAGQIKELRAQNAELVAALAEARKHLHAIRQHPAYAAYPQLMRQIDAALAVHPTPSAGNEGSLSTKEGRDDR
jgi:hypothetical protein